MINSKKETADIQLKKLCKAFRKIKIQGYNHLCVELKYKAMRDGAVVLHNNSASTITTSDIHAENQSESIKAIQRLFLERQAVV